MQLEAHASRGKHGGVVGVLSEGQVFGVVVDGIERATARGRRARSGSRVGRGLAVDVEVDPEQDERPEEHC